MRIEVSDTRALACVLDTLHTDYKILSNTRADIYAKLNVSQLTLALAEKNCEVLSLQERDESLESYYVSLVGGEKNA